MASKKSKSILTTLTTTINTSTKSKISTTSINTNHYVYRECHKGFKEVFNGIFVGKQSDIYDCLDGIDILVPLNSVDGRIWKNGWRNEIVYIPINDFSILPKDLEESFVEKLLNLHLEGKTMAIFCMGGHGRTGYFTSLLLNRLGIDDPISHLREKYCTKAVETNEQIKSISEFCNNPEFIEKYKILERDSWGYYADWGGYRDPSYNSSIFFNQKSTCKYCKHCLYYEEFGQSNWGECIWDNKTKSGYSATCENFEEEIYNK